jgi:integrase
MARLQNRLTAKSAAAITAPGRYADGGGLYLDVAAGGSKSWVVFYRSPVHRIERKGKIAGKMREMGLGAYCKDDGKADGKVTLAMAREKAAAARKLISDKKDPLDERDREALPAARVPTFGEIADKLIEIMAPGWKNEKHAYQWRHTLTVYAAALRNKPVNEIAVEDVVGCLKPHWEQRPETAARLRGRIERVLNAAKAQGHRSGENPAVWRGLLEHHLPPQSQLVRGHQAALPWEEVPNFLSALRKRDGVTPLALEFLLLTATRNTETRKAVWSEFDLVAKVWSIPGKRMKGGKTHRVPLTPRMLEILETVKPLRREDDFVFPGQKDGAPLSIVIFTTLLRRMKVIVTAHGFRSSFRDWAGDTGHSREVAEEALSHIIGNAVERAYRRSDALEQRRKLMEAWERFCGMPVGGNVLPLRKVEGR